MKASSWLKYCMAILVRLLCSCKPGVPRKYSQPDKMEDILYDYHIADALASDYELNHDTLQMRIYKHAILERYGCTEAEFDSSLIYYTRHTERLHKIYESLSNRLNNTAISLGASVTDMNRYGSLSSTGDTANIWNGDMSFVLMQHPAFNKYSFKLEADTTFHAGDMFRFNFDSQFIYQDGMRDAIVLLAMKLVNDSVITRTIHVSGTNHQTIEIADDQRVGIKEIKGFFILNNHINRANENQTTLKLMIINHLTLVRMHTPKPEITPQDVNTSQVDTLRNDTSRIPKPSPKKVDQIGHPRIPNESASLPSVVKDVPMELKPNQLK